jgi:simple sugar transport system substrate-binding protein
MIQKLREAIATQPDGIAMMGHPGAEAIMPFAKQAAEEGILMTYQNTDVPEVREMYGGGFIGANNYDRGKTLGLEALDRFDLQPGDRAVVYGNWQQPARAAREQAVVDVFSEAGLDVEKILLPPEAISDSELLTPTVTADLAANPDTKIVCFPTGNNTGASANYLKAAGYEPGEITVIGFDSNPAILEAFRSGYLQLSSDQQPYLQGYLPILSLTLAKAYDISLWSSNTGAGLITPDNFDDVAEHVEAGIR